MEGACPSHVGICQARRIVDGDEIVACFKNWMRWMSRCRQVSSHNKESMVKNVLATVAFNTGIAIVVVDPVDVVGRAHEEDLVLGLQ